MRDLMIVFSSDFSFSARWAIVLSDHGDRDQRAQSVLVVLGAAVRGRK
jgi:hypothetical protein